jgi:uncharacterized protein YcbX
MNPIGIVESLWRYPVKSMRGNEMPEAFWGFSGVFGDRCYAIKDSAARVGFPYLNAIRQPRMLGYQPRFRCPAGAAHPPNLMEAMSIPPGVTPANADPKDLDLDIVTPSGEILAVNDPVLLELLADGLGGEHSLSLARSDRALTDCRPVSLISLQTIRQIGDELGVTLDKLRFRANMYLDLSAGGGFSEDALVGRKLRIGADAMIMVLERDPRCKMISLDPANGAHDPEILRSVAKAHEANAGVYCAIIVEGIVRAGDAVAVAD